jgi:hypothetical protein|tara:strand:+ start:1407 stop:1511 length:105 start_codon:yes stop_codon:yes gene_type:complete
MYLVDWSGGENLIIHAPEAKDFNDQSKYKEKFTD